MKRSTGWLALALFGIITVASSGVARATVKPMAFSENANRPSEAFAFTSVAVVRLVVTYSDQQTANPSPLACTGLGTILTTTATQSQPSGSTNRTFILTDSSIVSPALPCQGAISAYITRYAATPKAWRLDTITAYLSTAYTGATVSPPVAIDTTALATFGLNGGPIALSLQSEPAVDLPTALVPAQQGLASYAIDLGASKAVPYTYDSLAMNQLGSTLTPLASTNKLPPTLALPTPTSAPTAIPTGTVIATATAIVGPTATARPVATITMPGGTTTALPPPGISPGAPVMSDAGSGIGTLAGIVVSTNYGYAVAGVQAINIALAHAFATPHVGTFSSHWQAGLDAYYTASPTDVHDPNYAAALTQFTYLRDHYPDFTGIAPWIAAAQAGSPNLNGSLLMPTATATTGDVIPGLPIHSRNGLLTLGIALFALLLGISFWIRAIVISRRAVRAAQPAKDRPDTARLPSVGSKSAPNTVERRVRPEELPPGWQTTSQRMTTPLPINRRRARLGLQVGAITDAGIRRRNDPNQDTILALMGARMQDGMPQPFGLFVVADGMGGHQSGQEASMRTIGVLVDAMLQPLLDGKNLDDDALVNLLRQGIEAANDTLNKRNLRLHSDMGTTITAALVTGDVATIANVGDSRTYHLQPTLPLHQITSDHSVVAGLVLAGIIAPDDVYTHPKRNQIYRSLGESDGVEVDTYRIVLQPGDQLLLCSDGLWEMVRDPQIEAIMRRNDDAQRAAEQCMQTANENGGADNVSAIVVRMLDESRAPAQVGVNIIAGPPSLIGQ